MSRVRPPTVLSGWNVGVGDQSLSTDRRWRSVARPVGVGDQSLSTTDGSLGVERRARDTAACRCTGPSRFLYGAASRLSRRANGRIRIKPSARRDGPDRDVPPRENLESSPHAATARSPVAATNATSRQSALVLSPTVQLRPDSLDRVRLFCDVLILPLQELKDSRASSSAFQRIDRLRSRRPTRTSRTSR